MSEIRCQTSGIKDQALRIKDKGAKGIGQKAGGKEGGQSATEIGG